MVVVISPEKEIGDQIRKKLGRACQYGQRIYSKVRFGEQETVVGPGKYGKRIYAIEKYGDATSYYGIYRIQKKGDKQTITKEDFYIPLNRKTIPQQANRLKFTNAVLGWQGLTDNQKEVYNKRAKYKKYSGYNLYLREYLLSH